MIGTITFNPSIDQNILVEKLVMDDANRAQNILRSAGGKGMNVSKVVKELGGDTCAFAIVGGLSGQFWEKLAREIDVPFWTLKINAETRMNTVLTDRRDGTQTRISAPGPHVGARAGGLFMKKLLSVRPRPAYWVLGGSLPEGMPTDTYEKFITRLQKQGIPCVLDTDDSALKQGVRAKPFMIKPNEFEMSRLMGRTFRDVTDYLSSARQLVREGIGIVVVSLGARGALFVTETEAFHATAPKVEVRSKVGAGDSLIGGFLWGLGRKLSLRESAKIGIAASTSAVMREAPRLCHRADVPGLTRRVKIYNL